VSIVLLLAVLALPSAARSHVPVDPAGTAEAEERGSRPGLAALSLEFDILQRIETLEVERIHCRKAGRFRFRCQFFIAPYDGGDLWRGSARMRAHSFKGRSYRYHYEVRGLHKNCAYPPVRCSTHRFTWKGQSHLNLFQAPGVERPGGAAREGREQGITFAAVGDTILGNTPTLPANPVAYLSAVRPQLSDDVVFGNLEGALTDASGSKCGGGSSNCFAFRNPPRFARALRAAGFTVMSNANNHFGDFGSAGQTDTLRALRRAGIAQTGLPGQVTVRNVKGTRVAFVGFASYTYAASLTDLPAARELIRRASQQADIVVVAFHAGAEGSGAQHVTGHTEYYLGENRGNPERFAHMAIRNGADLILGSGPHVLRGMEIYRDRLVAYSLGNFAGFHNFSLGGALSATAVLHTTLEEDGSFRAGRIASVRMVGPGRPVPDPQRTGAKLINRLSHADFGASAITVGGRGRIIAP
jgi:poly-gamma-glutamate capsule biosynthesis protein CapA/YwtB (metallophosphatase superfamily)